MIKFLVLMKTTVLAFQWFSQAEIRLHHCVEQNPGELQHDFQALFGSCIKTSSNEHVVHETDYFKQTVKGDNSHMCNTFSLKITIISLNDKDSSTCH